ncbi:MAG: sirohydrochlorin chelatase, partial [Flavobacteriaceae bacterium]|nr:sirohydrochlorin chelatase [Flavobacteriaceae bacterium]
MNKIGVLLCGHGTKLKEGVEAFKQFAKGFQDQFDEYETGVAFFHFSAPDLDEGVQELVDKGVSEIVVLPLFLFTGVHLQDDISCMMYQASKKHNIPIRMGNYMGVCEEMVSVVEKLVREVVPEQVLKKPNETILVMAGVGSSVIDANADSYALMRLVQERFRFPFAMMGYLSRKTFPSIEETLPNAGFLPFQNVVVVPYVFFKGTYMNRTRVAVEKFMVNNDDKKVFCTKSLDSSTALYDLLQKRLEEVLDGEVDFIKTMDEEVMKNYKGHHHDHCGHD